MNPPDSDVFSNYGIGTGHALKMERTSCKSWMCIESLVVPPLMIFMVTFTAASSRVLLSLLELVPNAKKKCNQDSSIQMLPMLWVEVIALILFVVIGVASGSM